LQVLLTRANALEVLASASLQSLLYCPYSLLRKIPCPLKLSACKWAHYVATVKNRRATWTLANRLHTTPD